MTQPFALVAIIPLASLLGNTFVVLISAKFKMREKLSS